MKVFVFSYYHAKEMEEAVKKHGLKVDRKQPDVVITFGGDGTVLTAEAEYPGVPKVIIKKGDRCERHFEYGLKDIDSVFKALKEGRFGTLSYNKVQAHLKARRLTGLNEVQIQNVDPRRALRFRVTVKDRVADNVIGDGLVAATAFGSTAYYRAIGYRPFKRGIRIGFNNTFPRRKEVILGPGQSAKVEILREKGWLAADNGSLVGLLPGDVVFIKESKRRGTFIKLKTK